MSANLALSIILIPCCSEDRMNQWRALLNDNYLFLGNWNKLKITPQTELECGA